MSFDDKKALTIRLFYWQHRRHTAAFHDVDNPRRLEIMARWFAVRNRVIPLCVKYGSMHPDSLRS